MCKTLSHTRATIVECTNAVYFVSFFFSAAALALLDVPNVEADEIVRKSMKIAGDICVYTNHNLVVETLEPVVSPVTGEATVTASS